MAPDLVRRRSTARPWRKYDKAPGLASNVQQPLIPTEFLDVGTQRLAVVSIFVLLQSYKIFELVFPKNTYSTEMFAIKYLFIDGLFWWLLPIFRVPWMCFSTWVNIFLTLSFFALNLLISSRNVATGAFLAALVKSLFQSEYTLSGTRASNNDLDDHDVFRGQYMVKILPESTAIMNPFNEKFCIDDTFNTAIYIPFVFNSTDPVLVQFSQIDLDSYSHTTLEFHAKDITKLKFPKSSDSEANDASSTAVDIPQASYAAVKVTKPGVYRLTKVSDEEDIESRLVSSDLIIPRCPSGSFAVKKDVNRCLSQLDTTNMIVVGVPPLKLKYTRFVLGKESIHTIESVQPENFASPLLIGGVPRHISPSDDLSWATPHEVSVSIDSSLTNVGEWIHNIDSVEDGLGNIVDFEQLFEKRGRLYSSNAPQDISSSFIVHPRPQIRYSNCNSQSPLIMPLGQSLTLPVELVGDTLNGPYLATFEFKALENGEINTQPKKITHTFKDNSEKLVIQEPGVYSLLSVKGKYCTGDVTEPSSCLVYVPPEPEVNVDFLPIEDKCAGPIGVQADLTFIGTPPFDISYRIVKDGHQKDTRTVTIREARHQLEFKPESAGVYSYEFFNLRDSIYKSKDYCSGKISTQLEIRALASASFRDEKTRKCCAGDPVSLDLELSGLPPFKLTYEIIGSSRRSPEVVDDIQDYNYRIDVPALSKGGKFAVSLVSIEDSRGCRTMLKEESIIEVRRQRPSVGFLSIDGELSVKTLENSNVNLPLRLSGEGPWNIELDHTSPEGKVSRKEITLHSASSAITVTETGGYTLVNVRDAYCPGEISESSSHFDVSWYDKPEISILQSSTVRQSKDSVFERDTICENSEDNFRVELQGYPPFNLVYDVIGPVKLYNQKLDVATKFANIKAVTSKPGTYTYKFKSLNDAVYSLSDPDLKQITVLQEVRSLPSASFERKGEVFKACSSLRDEDLIEDGIPVRLKGKAPYSITLNVFHKDTGRASKNTINNIEQDSFTLSSIFKDLGLGRHTVTFDSLSDSFGCVRHDFPEDEKVDIAASELPRAVTSDLRNNYCVGERIVVPLIGVAPFEVTYEFNGKLQRAKADSTFSRIASLPGTLVLKSLSDSASTCVMSLEEMLGPITIFQKPTVEIDENLSRQIIREGGEANLVFTFTGTPPFSFTYTRSEMVGKPARKKVVETHSASNIQGHHYTIKTHTQGFYEAIAVEDAFCSARASR